MSDRRLTSLGSCSSSRPRPAGRCISQIPAPSPPPCVGSWLPGPCCAAEPRRCRGCCRARGAWAAARALPPREASARRARQARARARLAAPASLATDGFASRRRGRAPGEPAANGGAPPVRRVTQRSRASRRPHVGAQRTRPYGRRMRRCLLGRRVRPSIARARSPDTAAQPRRQPPLRSAGSG